MFEILHYANWYLKCRILGKRTPIQSVVFITSNCNLQCRHCAVAKGVAAGKLPLEHFSFAKVRGLLQQCYAAGSRMVTFEGGEPLMWRDGDYALEDLIKEAKKIGFISTSFSTNGTLPIPNSQTDRIFVSLDGTREYHDAIRGQGAFDKAISHIAETAYPHISVNFVANVINWECIDPLMELVAKNRQIKGISVNFHTPHAGTEEMFLPWDKRQIVIDKVLKYKKAGYPVINSSEGLKRLRRNQYHRQCWITDFVLPDGQRYLQCMGAAEGICDKCGYGMGSEMSALYEFKISTILEGLKLFSRI